MTIEYLIYFKHLNIEFIILFIKNGFSFESHNKVFIIYQDIICTYPMILKFKLSFISYNFSDLINSILSLKNLQFICFTLSSNGKFFINYRLLKVIMLMEIHI